MDTLLSEAVALSSKISKILNSKIFDENQEFIYTNKTKLTHEAYIHVVKIAREEVRLHSGPVSDVQWLVLAKNDIISEK